MLKQKNYWQVVLAEVLNKESLDYNFVYTNMGPVEDLKSNRFGSEAQANYRRVRVELDGEFSGIYLTPREVDCLVVLSTGCTVKFAARELNLSHRTVEFYLKNLKAKFGCATKGELLAIVAEADLLSQIALSSEVSE